MKIEKLIIIICALGIVICCFLPWAWIPSLDKQISGFDTTPTRFGKPAILTIFFTCLVCIFYFLLKGKWKARVAFVSSALLLTWQLRNWSLIAACFFGECMDILFTFHLMTFLCFAIVLQLFSLIFHKKL